MYIGYCAVRFWWVESNHGVHLKMKIIPLTDYGWTRKDIICRLPVKVHYKCKINYTSKIKTIQFKTHVFMGGDVDTEPHIIAQNLIIYEKNLVAVHVYRDFKCDFDDNNIVYRLYCVKNLDKWVTQTLIQLP